MNLPILMKMTNSFRSCCNWLTISFKHQKYILKANIADPEQAPHDAVYQNKVTSGCADTFSGYRKLSPATWLTIQQRK